MSNIRNPFSIEETHNKFTRQQSFSSRRVNTQFNQFTDSLKERELQTLGKLQDQSHTSSFGVSQTRISAPLNSSMDRILNPRVSNKFESQLMIDKNRSILRTQLEKKMNSQVNLSKTFDTDKGT